MSNRTIRMNDALDAYLGRVSLRETDVQQRLREETAVLEYAGMQISPVQGQLMRMLAGLVGARRAIEVGVFTGYSALSVALALPEDGELVACDVNEEWTAIARRYWSEAGVDSKIRLEIAPAVETLDNLIREGRSGEFDIAFIDADKTSYDLYYERCLELLRPGGLVLVDNVLWSGKVADETDRSEDTVALRAFNAKLLPGRLPASSCACSRRLGATHRRRPRRRIARFSPHDLIGCLVVDVKAQLVQCFHERLYVPCVFPWEDVHVLGRVRKTM